MNVLLSNLRKLQINFSVEELIFKDSKTGQSIQYYSFQWSCNILLLRPSISVIVIKREEKKGNTTSKLFPNAITAVCKLLASSLAGISWYLWNSSTSLGGILVNKGTIVYMLRYMNTLDPVLHKTILVRLSYCWQDIRNWCFMRLHL